MQRPGREPWGTQSCDALPCLQGFDADARPSRGSPRVRRTPGEALTTVYVTGTGFASGAEIALMNGTGAPMPTIAAAGETCG